MVVVSGVGVVVMQINVWLERIGAGQGNIDAWVIYAVRVNIQVLLGFGGIGKTVAITVDPSALGGTCGAVRATHKLAVRNRRRAGIHMDTPADLVTCTRRANVAVIARQRATCALRYAWRDDDCRALFLVQFCVHGAAQNDDEGFARTGNQNVRDGNRDSLRSAGTTLKVQQTFDSGVVDSGNGRAVSGRVTYGCVLARRGSDRTGEGCELADAIVLRNAY